MIVVSAVWKTVGFSCIIYLASISSISVELYEAAYSDGAGRLAQLRHITLPGIMPTITILLVLAAPSLVNAGFDQIYLFQNPLNIKVSDIIESYVLRMGLGSGMYSYSAAIGILNSILSTSLFLLVNLFQNVLEDPGSGEKKEGQFMIYKPSVSERILIYQIIFFGIAFIVMSISILVCNYNPFNDGVDSAMGGIYPVAACSLYRIYRSYYKTDRSYMGFGFRWDVHSGIHVINFLLP